MATSRFALHRETGSVGIADLLVRAKRRLCAGHKTPGAV
jgi:hypothetical protein